MAKRKRRPIPQVCGCLCPPGAPPGWAETTALQARPIPGLGQALQLVAGSLRLEDLQALCQVRGGLS